MMALLSHRNPMCAPAKEVHVVFLCLCVCFMCERDLALVALSPSMLCFTVSRWRHMLMMECRIEGLVKKCLGCGVM